ncbi:MAG: hypothetical protein KGS09_16825 [Nitrospirae bacterium]|nr:hypothetical protein [Nitrospirota bacterium]MDE3042831.1 hypothetical protein [Nitrospirota bacterium]MDE3218845.1 hypothetical protein [Nitrospirota bacterium]
MSTDDAPYKLLLHGIDTLQCAYYLSPPATKHLNFTKLAVIKEQLRMDKSREPRAVTLGGMEFFLQPYGSSSGYPFVLTNEDFKIELGEFNNPSCFVTFRSQALWGQSGSALHDKFLNWAIVIGCEVQQPETLSRVDFCFDYSLAERDFDVDSFVSLSNKDSQHREHGAIQTFTFGKGDVVLRVYDKVAEIKQQSAKVWFYALWGQEEHVWRIEWQVRKPLLRSCGIRTFADLQEHQGRLLWFLVEHHDTLRSRTEDSNRSRWPLHPLWVNLQQRITELHTLETKQVEGKELVLDERLIRLTISIYGYLKRMAALSCVKQGQPTMSEEEAYGLLGERLQRLFDPMSWKADVQKRMKAIELGEW